MTAQAPQDHLPARAQAQPSLVRALVTWVLLLAGALGLANAALARDELPGRVGRIAEVEGKAWIYDDEQARWVEAWRNRAVTEGDRLSTERGARVQLGIGSTELRLGGNSEISFERLDDERLSLRLHNGTVAMRVRSREVVREIELRVGEARAWPQRTGHYRIDRDDGISTLTTWRGSLRVDTRDQRLDVDAGRAVELMREGRETTVVSWTSVAQDSFSDWVARDEQRDDRLAGERYVSPEMTGADDLDRHGRWDRHPDYGMVWAPVRVAVDWAPFRHGRWNWHVRWGWSWVDDAPWGFATSHYGRWLHWGGRWVWAPGSYVSRPIYSPALVAWYGHPGPGVSVSIGIGPTVGWIPLSPRDTYVPPFRHPPRYFDRVNQPHRRPGVPAQVPTGPISYGNNGVPNAVTVVPGHVLQQRQPVAPAVVHDAEAVRRTIGREPPGWSHGAPRGTSPAAPNASPAAPARVIAVPGGALPAASPGGPASVAGQLVPGGAQPLPRAASPTMGPTVVNPVQQMPQRPQVQQVPQTQPALPAAGVPTPSPMAPPPPPMANPPVQSPADGARPPRPDERPRAGPPPSRGADLPTKAAAPEPPSAAPPVGRAAHHQAQAAAAAAERAAAAARAPAPAVQAPREAPRQRDREAARDNARDRAERQ